jgi:beta-glucosidase
VETGDIVKVTLEVSNTGSCAGAEVIQVYVAPMSAPIERPVKELKAFHKIYLEAQESKRISIDLDPVMATSYWDETREKWCSEAGEYRVMVGTSSAETPLEASLRVSSTRFWTGIGPDAHE